MELTVPGCVPVPGGSAVLRLEVTTETALVESGYNESVSELDWDRLRGPLELRNWRPGDFYQARGNSKAAKVKELFQKARVPSWDRQGWPIVTSGDNIVWTRRFGAAEEFVARGACRILRVWEEGSAASGRLEKE